MREILFRGKRVSDGQWVEGSLVVAGSYCCILEDEDKIHPVDYPYLDKVSGIIDGKLTPVIPETVSRLMVVPSYGNYKGSRYFEGDIVELYDRIGIYCGNAIVIDESCITINGLGRRFPQDTLQATVIGNVWDNPELIGEKYANLYKYYHEFSLNEEE